MTVPKNTSGIQSSATNSSTGIPPPLILIQTVERISCFVLIVLIILALFGNTLVWVAFVSVKRLQRVTNFYIVSLATADLLVASVAMTTWLLNILFEKKILIPGSTIGTIYTLLDIACGTASIMNFTFVSIDRYFAITKPFSYQTLLSPPRVLATIAFSWAYAILVAVLKFYIDKKSYPLFVALVSFFLPTVMLIFTYSCIFAVARRHARVINVISGSRQQRKFSYVTELKAAKVISVVVGTFLVCWGPFLLANLVINYCVTCARPFPIIAVYILKLLQYTSSAVNPFIYTCLNAEFRVAVKRLICTKCWKASTRLSRNSMQMNELRTSNLKTVANADSDIR